MAVSMEELEILREAETLADGVWHEVAQWDLFQRDTLGQQVVRSADSAGANIAEAYGRYHYGEKIRFLYYARGSLFETKYWLNRAKSRELVDADVIRAYVADVSELVRRLNSFIAYIKKQKRNNGVREPTPTYSAEGNLTPEQQSYIDQ